MKEHSWVCTFVTKISLCFALYLAFNFGQPQKRLWDGSRIQSGYPNDMYFMSVAGDIWPLKEQTLLLKQMAKVAAIYNAKFVATGYFQSLKVPWYTTRSLKGQGTSHYLKHMRIPCGKIFDIIVVNSGLFQGPSTGTREHYLLLLTKTLEESISDWRIIVGFHPLLSCNGSTEAKDSPGQLHHIFLNYRVDAYLSGHACIEDLHRGSAEQLSDGSQKEKGPCLIPVNKILLRNEERVNGFLLHRVSPLEFVTCVVNLYGEVVHRIELQQSGRDIM